ncbi:hypothetical protein LLT7_01070 [Lactococcus cremoris subsp. cremoris TIFN7]|nr:hypothetical protein LLT7_01070 [Lactococcus cremoris subsp. cremoris TIFN7]
MSQNTKTILSNLFTLTSELSEPTSKLIHIEGANETPATQKDLAKGLRENLVNLTEVLGLSVDELTEPDIKIETGENKMTNEITEHLNKAKALLIEKYSDSIDEQASQEALKNIKKDFEAIEIYANESDTEPQGDEPQETVKSIIEEMQELTFAPHEISGNDTQVFADLLTDSIERLIKALGLNEMSLSAESENKPQELALKAQIQELYSLNDSMVTADPNHVPRYTDGTIIKLSDLVDMNVQALDNIAELIGFELEE